MVRERNFWEAICGSMKFRGPFGLPMELFSGRLMSRSSIRRLLSKSSAARKPAQKENATVLRVKGTQSTVTTALELFQGVPRVLKALHFTVLSDLFLRVCFPCGPADVCGSSSASSNLPRLPPSCPAVWGVFGGKAEGVGKGRASCRVTGGSYPPFGARLVAKLRWSGIRASAIPQGWIGSVPMPAAGRVRSQTFLSRNWQSRPLLGRSRVHPTRTWRPRGRQVTW